MAQEILDCQEQTGEQCFHGHWFASLRLVIVDYQRKFIQSLGKLDFFFGGFHISITIVIYLLSDEDLVLLPLWLKMLDFLAALTLFWILVLIFDSKSHSITFLFHNCRLFFIYLFIFFFVKVLK